MSKWFQRPSDSESSESESSEDEKQTVQQTTTAAAKKTAVPQGRKQYIKGFDDSSESEEENRVVKTGMDKRVNTMNAIIKDLKNHLKINDFGTIMEDFDKLGEEIARSGDLIFESKNDEILPLYIVRTFAHIENSIIDLTAEQKKKLNKTNSQAYNKLKQKFKKYMQGAGVAGNTYEDQLNKFREAPVWSDDEKKAKAPKEEKAKPFKAKKKDDEESEEEESEEEESEEEESEEESSEESEEEAIVDMLKIPREQMTPAQRRLKWVKKDRLPQAMQDKLKEKEKTKLKDTRERAKQTAGQATDIADKVFAEGGDSKETQLNLKNDFSIDYKVTDNVIKKLKEIQDDRMRGKFDPKYHTQVLIFMLESIKDNLLKIDVILNLLNTLFDSAKYTQLGFINRDTWTLVYDYIQKLLTLLNDAKVKESLRTTLTTKDVKGQKSEQDSDEDDSSIQALEGHLHSSADIEKSILPSLANTMEKLEHELLKAYQGTNTQSLQYVQRLRDENKYLFLCDALLKFFAEFNDNEKAARVAVLKITHLYFKHDALQQKIKDKLNGESKDVYLLEKTSQQSLEELAVLVNRSGTPRMKLRATLYLVYHHAIHNRYTQARDLLMKTHIGDIIHLQDITNQVLYNRSLTQIGMAAFRLGLIEESHDILMEVCQHSRLKEILAQGISKFQDKPHEFEKEEMKRQIPFHMHINLQLLDCIYMLSAMLLEIPNIAENQYSVNKKVISKNFKKLIDQYDSKAFYLAAETYRDNIVMAAKSLNKSDWKKALEHIFSIKLITKMPEFDNQEFKNLLIQKFKESALIAYLCRAAKSYTSFSLESLIKLFEIEESKLIKLLSKNILQNKIQAHIERDKKLLVLDTQSSEVKELQQLSLQYVEKMEHMVENNERLIDIMNNGQIYQYKERTMTEIQQLNQAKKNKLITKATAAGVYALNQPMISAQGQQYSAGGTQPQRTAK